MQKEMPVFRCHFCKNGPIEELSSQIDEASKKNCKRAVSLSYWHNCSILTEAVLSQAFICRTVTAYVMLFYSFFKSLVGKDVVVELKNDLSICGTLHSVDQAIQINLLMLTVISFNPFST